MMYHQFQLHELREIDGYLKGVGMVIHDFVVYLSAFDGGYGFKRELIKIYNYSCFFAFTREQLNGWYIIQNSLVYKFLSLAGSSAGDVLVFGLRL